MKVIRRIRVKKTKRIISSIILFCNLISFSGCFSYRDINKLLFITSVIVDIDKDNRPILYVEAFKPFRSSSSGSERGQRVFLKGTGKTTYEALRDIHLSTSYKLNYTQHKAVIFTCRAAKVGIDNWLDIFDRHQEFIIRPYIAITNDNPEDLMKLKIAGQEYLGIIVKELIDNEGASTRAVRLALNEYLNRRLIGSKTEVITLIGIKKNVPEERVEIDGGAILKDDKFMEILPRTDGQGYNFLMNTLKTGSLEISNPQQENNFVSLNILSNRTSTDLTYDGKVIRLRKTINIKTNIEEIEKGLVLSSENIFKVKQKSEDNIKRACVRVFEKYKEQDLDIFQVKETLERKYPNAKVENPLKITELEVVVNENIEGSPDTQDFWD
nr:Ger(x)C family spore germination protein [Clostridium swellfunianum]